MATPDFTITPESGSTNVHVDLEVATPIRVRFTPVDGFDGPVVWQVEPSRGAPGASVHVEGNVEYVPGGGVRLHQPTVLVLALDPASTPGTFTYKLSVAALPNPQLPRGTMHV